MMYKFAVLLAAVSAVSAAPIKFTREVPQEHSHEPFLVSVRASLQKNNPDKISDPVFGLLGNAAASQGQGLISDTDCLQQATADQAFTNAKAAKDVQGMVNALVYRAIERNTGKVGLASVLCTKIKAKNPEIAALQQHQDPASAGAKDINKKIALELAKQIASVGGDPLIALKSGTFAPGNLNDNTGKGNTCDDANDPNGCIFTQKLIVEDATAAEILAAVGKGGNNAGDKTGNNNDTGNKNGNGGVDSTATCPPPKVVTVTVIASATQSASATKAATPPKNTNASSSSKPPASSGNSQGDNKGSDAPAANGNQASNTQSAAPPQPTSESSSGSSGSSDNLQSFTGGLGGIAAPPITKGGKGFVVDGDDFLNLGAAKGRSCDKQHNACANAANASKTAGFSVGDCDKQNDQCKQA